MAEWLLWNWWRLLWEPRPEGVENGKDEDKDDTWFEWVFAHNLSSIGEGYLWPDIEMASDGGLMHLASSPTGDPNEKVFRFVGASRLEDHPGRGIHEGRGRIRLCRAGAPGRGKYSGYQPACSLASVGAGTGGQGRGGVSRMEAILGYDPGEGEDDEIREYLADAATLGMDIRLARIAGHLLGSSAVSDE